MKILFSLSAVSLVLVLAFPVFANPMAVSVYDSPVPHQDKLSEALPTSSLSFSQTMGTMDGAEALGTLGGGDPAASGFAFKEGRHPRGGDRDWTSCERPGDWRVITPIGVSRPGAAVPEPTSMALMLVGAGAAAGSFLRRRRSGGKS